MNVRNFIRFAVAVGAVALFAGCGNEQPIGLPGPMPQSNGYPIVPRWQARHLARTTCPQVIGKPTCLALLVEQHGIAPLCSPSSSCGWTPSQLQAAYNLTSKIGNGSGTNIAVIEAGDLAKASTDLSVYRKAFGLGKGHVARYNEHGERFNYPASCQNYGWCLETDLDIDMVSAACPKCNILIVESKGGISDFEQAEGEAVSLGATIVSNSWICYGSADCGDPNFSRHFDAPGTAYLASTGDAGPDNIGAPSALASVIAVGGTQLALSGSKYDDSLWDGAGGGCADPGAVGGNGIPKPSWQKDPDCSYRTVGDVSSEAGCSPGVAVYSGVYGGWIDVCGTSVAAPFTAGVIALAGNAATLGAGKRFWTLSKLAHKIDFHHPSGSGGSCGNYLCGDGRYKLFYSGPGGWGTPNGIKGY